jgi:hypothetical protein
MERGGFPSFFLEEKMLTNFIWFMVGAMVTWFFNYIMGLGHSVVLLKQTQQSCATLFTTSEQGLQEILQLKYIAMEEAKRSEQNIISQKYIDQLNIDSVKKSIMRNYVEQFPSAYVSAIEYKSWEELEEYVNDFVQKQKEQR